MGILGIKNRTENWKTVRHFYGLSWDRKARLVQKLSKSESLPTGEIELELFWFGMRDYIRDEIDKGVPKKVLVEKLANQYKDRFSNLGKNIKDSGYGLQVLDDNYDVCIPNRWAKLYSNLRRTEIDIVLQSKEHLFVGEAKSETDKFGANPSHVLVHQLVRQYVMAQILVDLTGTRQKIVPFVVGAENKIPTMRNRGQVKFMKKHYGLKEENILSWDEV